MSKGEGRDRVKRERTLTSTRTLRHPPPCPLALRSPTGAPTRTPRRPPGEEGSVTAAGRPTRPFSGAPRAVAVWQCEEEGCKRKMGK